MSQADWGLIVTPLKRRFTAYMKAGAYRNVAAASSSILLQRLDPLLARISPPANRLLHQRIHSAIAVSRDVVPSGAGPALGQAGGRRVLVHRREIDVEVSRRATLEIDRELQLLDLDLDADPAKLLLNQQRHLTPDSAGIRERERPAGAAGLRGRACRRHRSRPSRWRPEAAALR